MKNNFVRVEYSIEEANNRKRYNLRLIKNLKYTEFFTESEEEIQTWKRAF